MLHYPLLFPWMLFTTFTGQNGRLWWKKNHGFINPCSFHTEKSNYFFETPVILHTTNSFGMSNKKKKYISSSWSSGSSYSYKSMVGNIISSLCQCITISMLQNSQNGQHIFLHCVSLFLEIVHNNFPSLAVNELTKPFDVSIAGSQDSQHVPNIWEHLSQEGFVGDRGQVLHETIDTTNKFIKILCPSIPFFNLSIKFMYLLYVLL